MDNPQNGKSAPAVNGSAPRQSKNPSKPSSTVSKKLIDGEDGKSKNTKPASGRASWLVHVVHHRNAEDKRYSPLLMDLAAGFAWDLYDQKKRGVFVGLGKMCEYVRAEERAVLGALSLLRNDGWIEKIKHHSPGHPSGYQLTEPDTAPANATPSIQPKPEIRTRAQTAPIPFRERREDLAECQPRR